MNKKEILWVIAIRLYIVSFCIYIYIGWFVGGLI